MTLGHLKRAAELEAAPSKHFQLVTRSPNLTPQASKGPRVINANGAWLFVIYEALFKHLQDVLRIIPFIAKLLSYL